MVHLVINPFSHLLPQTLPPFLSLLQSSLSESGAPDPPVWAVLSQRGQGHSQLCAGPTPTPGGARPPSFSPESCRSPVPFLTPPPLGSPASDLASLMASTPLYMFPSSAYAPDFSHGPPTPWHLCLRLATFSSSNSVFPSASSRVFVCCRSVSPSPVHVAPLRLCSRRRPESPNATMHSFPLPAQCPLGFVQSVGHPSFPQTLASSDPILSHALVFLCGFFSHDQAFGAQGFKPGSTRAWL